ncbi:ATP-binding protein [Pedobacter sp. L105]|uniref:sensor histidine kinase n=1 Tax=Pedobacter sp. L105 TaxID=1641871 RepID=UPI00131C8BC8|nr:ATP-binding protein [Pedobacter sp. L105]
MRKKELNENAMVLVRKILGTIKDAEMGQRGYLLTGRSKYILPYTKALRIISGFQYSLTSLIKAHFDNRSIQTNARLNSLITAKLIELKKTIDLKDQNKNIQVLQLINSDMGENDMNAIRKMCNDMLDVFYVNVRQEDQKVSETLAMTEISISIFSVLVIIVITIMRVKLYNRRRKNIRLFEELALQNSKLITQQQELKGLSIDFSARNAELEHFTHIISHDLRGPLSNMISLIQIMEEDGLADETDPVFKMLKNASLGLFRKLDDLIILLRQRQGGILLKETISLSQLLGEVKISHKMEIERSGTIIEADFIEADELLFVKIYMQSILQNLISNAIKYRDPLRTNCIILKTYQEGDTLRLNITDNGRGIDMEKYGNEMFGLFKTFHTGLDSHGIGLYLVKKQVVEMNGNITVQSETGKGTTFSITVPT